MAWEEVTPSPTHDFKENKELVGVFMSKEEDVGPNGSNIYNFENEKGERVAVWGNAILDSRFKTLTIGEKVKIEYLGKAKSEKTDREYHNFKVYKEKE